MQSRQRPASSPPPRFVPSSGHIDGHSLRQSSRTAAASKRACLVGGVAHVGDVEEPAAAGVGLKPVAALRAIALPLVVAVRPDLLRRRMFSFLYSGTGTGPTSALDPGRTRSTAQASAAAVVHRRRPMGRGRSVADVGRVVQGARDLAVVDRQRRLPGPGRRPLVAATSGCQQSADAVHLAPSRRRTSPKQHSPGRAASAMLS